MKLIILLAFSLLLASCSVNSKLNSARKKPINTEFNETSYTTILNLSNSAHNISSAIGSDFQYTADEQLYYSTYYYSNSERTSLTIARFNANGSLDTTFGNKGFVITNTLGYDSSYGTSIKVQSDNKVLLAGIGCISRNECSQRDFLLARFNFDGTLDSTFGINGLFNFTSGDANGGYVQLQSDNKIILIGNSGSRINIYRINHEGTLDTTFGNNGKIEKTFGNLINIYGLKILSDDKILTFGSYQTPTYYTDIALMRFNSNGLADTSFGTNGLVTTNLGLNTISTPKSIKVLADNKIILVGNTNNDLFISRYDSIGNLDNTFGSNADGKEIIDVQSNSIDACESIDIQSDNKIILAASRQSSAFQHLANLFIVRLNQNGVLDNSFGANGFVDTNIKKTFWASTKLQILNNGQFHLMYSYFNEITHNALYTRLNSDGIIDSSFGVNGFAIFDPPATSNDKALSIKYLNSNKLLIGGYSHSVSSEDFMLLRFNFDGTLDLSFGIDGKVLTDIDTLSIDRAEMLYVLESGKILLAGTTKKDYVTKLVVAQYQEDGSIDANFGVNGISIVDLGAFSSFNCNKINVDNVNKIYLGCSTYINSYQQVTLIRLNENGTLDTSFGVNAFKEIRVTSDKNEAIENFSILEDGKILVSGSHDSSFYFVQLNVDGSLDNTFGVNGVKIPNWENSNSKIKSFKILSDGKIQVFGYSYLGSPNTYFLARLFSDGNLDTSFGYSGFINISLPANTVNYDYLSTTEILSDNKLYLSGIINNSSLFVNIFDLSGTLIKSIFYSGFPNSTTNEINPRITDLARGPNDEIFVSGIVIKKPSNNTNVVFSRFK